MPGYDLHTHTTFSDGTTSPEHNVALAVERGLDGLGVTDHDTTATWERARAAAEGTDLEIVPGAELSAELQRMSVHILGYWFDPDDAALSGELDRLRTERETRAEQIVGRFVRELDIPISFDRVRAIAGGAPIGRPHIASAVVETGAAEDVREVFDRWLHDGGPAYVAKYAVDPDTCIALVRAAGGVASLAHPGLFGPDSEGLSAADIEPMIDAGLAGIEADHPDHTPEQVRAYRDLAAAHGLVVTAGSDYHGDRKDLQLGEATTPREHLERLRAALPAPRGA